MPVYKVRAIVETVFYSKTEVTTEEDVHAKMDWYSLLEHQTPQETFEVDSFVEIQDESELPDGWTETTCPFGRDVEELGDDCSGTFRSIILQEHPDMAKLDHIISLIAQLKELGCDVDISDVAAEEKKKPAKKPAKKASTKKPTKKASSKKKPAKKKS